MDPPGERRTGQRADLNAAVAGEEPERGQHRDREARGDDTTSPIHTPTEPAADVETLDFLGCAARILATGGDTGLVEFTVPPRHMPPLHVHRHEDEGFYVLEGEVTLHLEGGRRILARPGDYVVAPRDVAHAYEVGDAPARWLVVSAPAGFERFVAAVAALEELDPDVLGAVAAAHEIETLGPPGSPPGRGLT